MLFPSVVSRFALTVSQRSIAVVSRRLIQTSTWCGAIFKIQDEADFKKNVLENSNLVVLDFYATWCGPCKMLTPRLETLVGTKESEKKGFDLAKVDVDELETIAADYNVQSVPAVFAIRNGKIVDQFVGLKDEDQLNSFVEGALNK